MRGVNNHRRPIEAQVVRIESLNSSLDHDQMSGMDREVWHGPIIVK